MAKYLQLYLDNDFILPIGVSEFGGFQKYIDEQASRCLWLYFSKHKDVFEANKRNKDNFEAGRTGYFGDFWTNISDGLNVPGETFPYIELLDLSRIISRLREWSNASIASEKPDIVLNFSTVIPLKARRTFAEYIEEKIGKVRSYSVEINDLLSSKVVADHQTLSPSFGDQLMIIQSSGRNILLSVQTWCGDQFLQGDAPFVLEKKGNEFLRYALAKMVVDAYEQDYRMLRPEQQEKEYLYQMQFTEKWLQNRKGDEDFWIDDFHYMRNMEKVCSPILIDGKQLNLKEKEAIRETIDAISKYYVENIVNRHLHTILFGEVFDDEVFLRSCVSATSSDGKYTVFNANALQEAMGRYNVRYPVLTEELKDIERLYWDKENERLRIRKYVKNAEKLGALREAIDNVQVKITKAVNDVETNNSILCDSWTSWMKQSAFKEADAMVSQMSTNDELMVAKTELIDVLKRIEENNSLLIDIVQLKEVVPIVNDIRKKETELRELSVKTDNLNNLPRFLKEKVQYYRSTYGKYQELKRQFDVETTLVARKRLVEQMKELTMEDLPVIDVQPITGRITIDVQEIKKFFGTSKKIITIRLYLDNPLPCRGVLIVSPKLISSVPRDRNGVFIVDIEKGADGEVYENTVELKDFGFGLKLSSIFVKFWPHEDERIPINRFNIQGGGMVRI